MSTNTPHTPTHTENQLRAELAALSPSMWSRLRAAGFDSERLIQLASTLFERKDSTESDIAARRDARNRVTGEVRPPSDEELICLPGKGADDSEARRTLQELGETAIRSGELAFCVMAGGMATRMGGIVKALVEAFDGKTFLDLRLFENQSVSRAAGRPVPLWLMTSEATDEQIKGALAKSNAPPNVATFMQDLGLRLTQSGNLFRGDDGEVSPYATGHGDLVDALRRSGLLRTFRSQGGKYVWIANLDNLGASVDPVILGAFIASKSDVMVEVAEKAPGDKGGIPVHAQGKLQVLEEFRLPRDFDASRVRYFNTNTFLVQAAPLEETKVDWNWFEVEKKVDSRIAIQFERLLQELTSSMRASYVRIPREGTESRFLPVKDFDELEKRRAVIQLIARERGMSPA